ncbi:MAG TPA: dephospho-CoA kinase [Arthrobacter sp.]|nr:dephospho-CoA kinase [Arthrobacter sp.]
MLRIGLTGGIAAGKSLAAQRLVQLGATLIDADALAREVVKPGSEGLRAVADAFGPGILDDDGGIDRAALGAMVFDNPDQRGRLNAIVHPLVRARAGELAEAAGEDAVVVQDIPLLVETGQSTSFHLVLVIDAPEEERLRRMMEERGMSEADARSRIAAQASRGERNNAADVVLENTGPREELLSALDQLWEERLKPFNQNLLDGALAPRSGPPVLVDPKPEWATQAELLAGRIHRSDTRIQAVDHVGSTAVPDMPAKDVLDLQVTVASLDDADAAAGNLAAAGFPHWPGIGRDTPKPSHPDPADWGKRLHGNADPGRKANVHVRVHGSPGWRYALAFRDWLRDQPEMAAVYLAEKQRLAELHATDASTGRYAREKEEWFSGFADRQLNEWIENTGWRPRSG